MEPSYPGYNVPLRHDIEYADSFPIGAHWANNDSVTEMLQVREVFMMALMDQLTDKAEWERKVLDDEIVAKWRKEAATQPEDDLYALILEDKDLGRLRKPRERMITEKVFDCCIEELKCKAEYFKQTSLIPTLDTAGRVVVKSDVAVQPALHQRLVESFIRLHSDQASNVDWHPRSNDTVQDLVHPSMYPFVYGRSNFFPAEIVGLKDAVRRWAGKGDVMIAKDAEVDSTMRNIPDEFWSDNYQWLPANLKFSDHGLVSFTSYINNLHPEKYPEIYKALEELIDVAIPAWNQCLPLHIDGNEPHKAGRVNVRLSKPTDSRDNSDEKHWTPKMKSEHVQKYHLKDKDKSNYDYAYESYSVALDDLDIDSDTEEKLPSLDDEISQARDERRESKRRLRAHREAAWQSVKDPAELPLPPKFEHIDYATKLDLRRKFNETGLQVIVKMASIELTPEKPHFPLGSWHTEGQLNERICATALYYIDSENVTESHLTFRMASEAEQSEFPYGQDEYEWIERVYGTLVGSMNSDPSLQVFGSVETRPGRLLTFPNVFQHRVSSFSLKDKTKPGYRRFVALWLIDPHRRIISTANVPPQQLDWWAEAVFGTKGNPHRGSMPPGLFHLILSKYPQLAGKYRDTLAGQQAPSALPRELWDMVSNDQAPLPGLISLEEAKEHRLRLMDERSRFHEGSDKLWKSWTYRFCEH